MKNFTKTTVLTTFFSAAVVNLFSITPADARTSYKFRCSDNDPGVYVTETKTRSSTDRVGRPIQETVSRREYVTFENFKVINGRVRGHSFAFYGDNCRRTINNYRSGKLSCLLVGFNSFGPIGYRAANLATGKFIHPERLRLDECKYFINR